MEAEPTSFAVWQWQRHFRGQFIMFSAVTAGTYVRLALGVLAEELRERYFVATTSSAWMFGLWMAGQARDQVRAQAVMSYVVFFIVMSSTIFATFEIGMWDNFRAGHGLQAKASVGLHKLTTVWGNMVVAIFVSVLLFHANAIPLFVYLGNAALIFTVGCAAAEAAQAEQLRLDPTSTMESTMKVNIGFLTAIIGPSLYVGAWKYARLAYEQEQSLRELTRKEKDTMRNLMAITFHELRKYAQYRCMSR